MWKRRRSEKRSIPTWLDWLGDRGQKPAQQLAIYLQAKAMAASVLRVRWVLAVLLVVLLGINAAILVKAVDRHPSALTDPIHFPRRLIRAPQRIRLPDHFLDSLLKDSTRRRAYDSLLRARPGLADTIRQLHP